MSFPMKNFSGDSYFNDYENMKHNMNLNVIFRSYAEVNESKSSLEGRPIYDEIEIIEIRRIGSKDVTVHRVTQAEKIRFRDQYEAFKQKKTGVQQGTPLEDIPFITASQRAEWAFYGIQTAEQLISISDIDLDKLGWSAADCVRKVKIWMEKSKDDSYVLQLAQNKEEQMKMNADLMKMNADLSKKLADLERKMAEQTSSEEKPKSSKEKE